MAEIHLTYSLESRIERLLEHFRIKPTMGALSIIYSTLRSENFTDIPAPKFKDPGTNSIMEYEEIVDYCDRVRQLIKQDQTQEQTKKNTNSDVFKFDEADLLPHNVYLTYELDDEIIEEEIIDDDITTDTESFQEVDSDADASEGYEIYESDDSADFSD